MQIIKEKYEIEETLGKRVKKHIDVKSNRPTSEMEVSYPMTREEAKKYVDKLSRKCPIEYE